MLGRRTIMYFCMLRIVRSDVKFHEIFRREISYEIFREIFHEIFREIFQKFHDGL